MGHTDAALDEPLVGDGESKPEPRLSKASVWRYAWFVLCVDLQAVSFGFTLAFTAGTLDDMVVDLDLCGSDWTDDDALCGWASWLVSVAALASLVGGLVAGPLAAAAGRRPTYLLNSLCYFAGYTSLGVAQSKKILFLGRALSGFAAGIAGVVAPMYVAEVSPPHLRGQLGALFNICIAVGVLLVNLLCHPAVGLGWRQLAWLAGNVPPVLSGLTMFMFPESPQFLTARVCRATSQAEHSLVRAQLHGSLQWLHGADEASCREDANQRIRFHRASSLGSSMNGDGRVSSVPGVDEAGNSRLRRGSSRGGSMPEAQIQQVLDEVGADFDPEHLAALEAVGPSPSLCDGRHRFAALLGVGAVVGFGLSAVNCVNAYTGTILKTAGISDEASGSVGYAATQLGVALIGLRFADRFGRKTLLCASALGCAVSLVVCSLAFTHGDLLNPLALVGALAYVGFISVGMGPFSWVYAAEILPDAVRDAGMSLAIALFWALTFAQETTFSFLLGAFGGTATFCFFAACNLAVFAFFATYLVETRGRSLADIQQEVLRGEPPNGDGVYARLSTQNVAQHAGGAP